jgi:ArsR family transcriptional regulator
MLKAAKRRANGLTNLDLRKGDLAALPLAPGEADAAVMILALTYVPEPRAAIREMGRVLKPGGRGVIVDLLRHDRDDFRRQLGQRWAGFEPAELRKMLDEAGFKDAGVTPLPPDANAKGPALFVATGTKN